MSTTIAPMNRPEALKQVPIPDFVAEALRLAELGLHPVPVIPNGKVPISAYRKGGGFNPVLKTSTGIRKAWRENPMANIALSLDGLIQVDLDTTKAVETVRGLGEYETPTIRTPRYENGEGGIRMIFWEEEGLFGKKLGKDGTGIEWGRGATMIGVIPPSVFVGKHSGGYTYETNFATPIKPISDYPALLSLLQETEKKNPRPATKKTGTNEKGVLYGMVPVGERNAWLASQAARLRGQGYTKKELPGMLMGLNHGDRIEAPLDEAEIKQIAQSAATLPSFPWQGPNVEDLILGLRARHGLDKNGIAVLRVLLNRCNSRGVCDPGPTLLTLGESIGSEKGARKGVERLMEAGLMTRLKRGFGNPTRYVLDLDAEARQ